MSSRPTLLTLPVELRQQVYTYLLPYNAILNDLSTGRMDSQTLNLAHANQRLRRETLDYYYHNNTFRFGFWQIENLLRLEQYQDSLHRLYRSLAQTEKIQICVTVFPQELEKQPCFDRIWGPKIQEQQDDILHFGHWIRKARKRAGRGGELLEELKVFVRPACYPIRKSLRLSENDKGQIYWLLESLMDTVRRITVVTGEDVYARPPLKDKWAAAGQVKLRS